MAYASGSWWSDASFFHSSFYFFIPNRLHLVTLGYTCGYTCKWLSMSPVTLVTLVSHVYILYILYSIEKDKRTLRILGEFDPTVKMCNLCYLSDNQIVKV